MDEETLGTIMVAMFTVVVVLICTILWNTAHTIAAILATIILGGVALWADSNVVRYYIRKFRNNKH